MGTIFIGASFTILGLAATNWDKLNHWSIFISAMTASVFMYLLWFLHHWTSGKVSSVCYNELQRLEEELGIEIHRKIHQKVKWELWYWLVRDHLYSFFLVALIASWALLAWGTVFN
jgi:hypothetical protein